MKTFQFIYLVAAAVCVVCFTGCSPMFTWSYEEVKRVKSPDSRFDAVIITGDAGAVTTTRTFVLIVPAGRQIDTNTAPSDAVFVADKLKGFQVFWKNTRLVVIQYDEARISNFNNDEDVSDGQDYYPIETRLAPTSTDFSVPLEDRVPFPAK